MGGPVAPRDATAVEALAVQIARMRDARSRVDDEGMIVLDSHDKPMAHPCIAIERMAAAEVRRWRSNLAESAISTVGQHRGEDRQAVDRLDEIGARRASRRSAKKVGA